MSPQLNPTQLQRPLALPGSIQQAAAVAPGTSLLGASPQQQASPFAASPANADLISLASSVVSLLSLIVSSATGQTGAAGGASAGLGLAGSVPIGAGNSTGAQDGTSPVNVFTANDYRNFLLAGSQGGTSGTSETIDPRFSDPNSRFANTGNNQFQTAVAGMYTNQFKAYALGVDAVYTPGKDINQLSNNLAQVQNVQMTPEAELFSKVAALYRGNLTGGNLYNNPALQQLLVKWGRTDIASQPNVGNQNGDVQSIGGIVKALNEEPNPAIRQAWLQEIFDFQGNTPSSPSGAVPNVVEYQQAINIIRSGAYDELLRGFQGTPGA